MKPPRLPTAPAALLLRQLAAALHAGQAPADAIAALGRWSSGARDCPALYEAMAKAAPGGSLAEPLAAFPASFPAEAVSLVADSERLGSAAAALELLADTLEQRRRRWLSLGGALAWPLVGLGWLMLVAMVVSIFVVPAFKEVFGSFGAELPALTRLLITLSDLVAAWWWLALLLGAAAAWALRSGRVRTWRPVGLSDRALRLPVIGAYLHAAFLLRLARLLEPVLEGRLAAAPALAYLRATTEVQALAARVAALEAALASGQALPAALASHIELGGDLALALEFDGPGAASGRGLARTVDMLDAEVMRRQLRLQQLLVVTVYLIMGLTVGAFVFALYLPIFQLGSVL